MSLLGEGGTPQSLFLSLSLMACRAVSPHKGVFEEPSLSPRQEAGSSRAAWQLAAAGELAICFHRDKPTLGGSPAPALISIPRQDLSNPSAPRPPPLWPGVKGRHPPDLSGPFRTTQPSPAEGRLPLDLTPTGLTPSASSAIRLPWSVGETGEGLPVPVTLAEGPHTQLPTHSATYHHRSLFLCLQHLPTPAGAKDPCFCPQHSRPIRRTSAPAGP